ncbi:MAG TPA: alpha-glucuronidase family glycosyl hydrolase [Verrucomicrobiae bacterium]|nr:alpha-glucuronidase family glycosyl hydrolase [Verrucomicrobiae bacterium]
MRQLFIVSGLCAGLGGVLPGARAAWVELRNATLVYPSKLAPSEKKAVQMLREEAHKRVQVWWPESTRFPSEGDVIAVGTVDEVGGLPSFAGLESAGSLQKLGAEGYLISTRRQAGRLVVFVVGKDSRGLLFGIGRLLRELRMGRGTAELDEQVNILTSPAYPLRGHQLGYRPKCNSYDAWDLPDWEQYYRDLAVFGCNTVELIPPRSDDDADSPHFHRAPIDMMVDMSRLADEYGLDVSVWYPAMDADYSNPATVESALKEWAVVFEKLPRIDAVFVPGGDPGHTEPKHLLALLEKQTRNLHRFHPKAQMWMSPQSFDKAWFDEFIDLLKNQQPSWLSGIVFGPQVRVSMEQLRALVPKRYPIRNYPDITHSRQCQFPVPDWDVAYAVTEARECINPRPVDEAAIFRKLQPSTIGFVTYSEGCNDDVNKCVWSALGWDPGVPVSEILQQYARYFVGEPGAAEFAKGISALETDWRGSLLTNNNPETTLACFQSLEKAASPAQLRNWRFQQALFRAYYDAYVKRRLRYETDLEREALQVFQRDGIAVTTGIPEAEEILDRAIAHPVEGALRARIFELGEALFQSIGMQLSVSKYKAIGIDRGASLDTLDYPLNNRPWLKARFQAILQLQTETERRAAIHQIIHWADPGPGGFYDDLGNPAMQPHLVRKLPFAEDPGAMTSPRSDYEEDLVADEPDEKTEGPRRVSWMDHAESLYDAPLQLTYPELDPNAHYRMRVVYAGDNPKRKIRLVAQENLEIHPLLSKPVPFTPLEFDVPIEATRGGTLTLSWFGEPGLGGNGRGCQVSEVWLLKDPQSATR